MKEKKQKCFFGRGKRRESKEEKDSCPTTTQASQQNCVISRRNYITSISVSLAPSVHPSIFQTTVYIEYITTYLTQRPSSPLAQNCRLHFLRFFQWKKNIFLKNLNESVYLWGCYVVNDALNTQKSLLCRHRAVEALDDFWVPSKWSRPRATGHKVSHITFVCFGSGIINLVSLSACGRPPQAERNMW